MANPKPSPKPVKVIVSGQVRVTSKQPNVVITRGD